MSPYHRTFWVFWLAGLLFLGQPDALAQVPLNCCNNPPPASQPTRLTNLGHWRLGGGLGVSQQYQRKGSDQSLYLGRGFQTTLNADYFLGHHWGIEATLGYQSLTVRNQYVSLIYQDAAIPANFVPALLPKAGMQSFQATIGPLISIPLKRRLTLDLGLKGGIFYNNAPVVGAFDPKTKLLVFRLSPNYKRFSLGVQGFGNLMYRLSPRLQVGLGGSGAYSRFGYTVDRTDGQFFQFLRRLGVFGGQLMVVYTFEPHPAPMAPALPTCYPPVLDNAMPSRYEIGVDTRPVLKWRSSAPVYTDDERYTVRLYSMPGNRLLAENTVRDTEWAWPAKIATPDTSSFYFYSVHSTRTDYVDQICRSELSTGTLEFFKRIAIVLPPAPEAPPLTIELFEFQPVIGAVQKSIVPKRTTVRRYKRPSGAGISSRKKSTVTYRKRRTYPPKTVVESGVVGVKESLIYREVTRQREVVWPAGVPYPSKPTMYRYVVKKANERTGAAVGDYMLLVEPGGTVRVITQEEKQQRLKVPK